MTEESVVAAESDDTGATVVGVVGDDTGVQAVGAVATDYQNTVVVAAFADSTAAIAAYEALLNAEIAGTVAVEGVLVINTDANGKVSIQKMTDHSTKTGVKWGVAGGLVLGLVFPPTLLASAVTWGAAGGILGKLRNESHKSQVAAALAGTLGPNQSGILALVTAGDVAKVTAAIPQATKVRTAGVDDKTAEAISTAAKQNS